MERLDDYGVNLLKNIGERMKHLRKHYAIPVDRLTEVLGVSRNQYYLYEHGESSISVVGLKRIADF